jgi:tRNA(adenine34) deaminase
MNTDKTHTKYMTKCLELAKIALSRNNPPVGAILVCNGEIIGKGIESGRSTKDITNHAEINAINDAIKNQHEAKISESVMYTTHEPCIMCSYVIRHHKIGKLVYGSSVEYIGGHTSNFKLLETRHVPKWEVVPEIVSGILEVECNLLVEESSKLNR